MYPYIELIKCYYIMSTFIIFKHMIVLCCFNEYMFLLTVCSYYVPTQYPHILSTFHILLPCPLHTDKSLCAFIVSLFLHIYSRLTHCAIQRHSAAPVKRLNQQRPVGGAVCLVIIPISAIVLFFMVKMQSQTQAIHLQITSQLLDEEYLSHTSC